MANRTAVLAILVSLIWFGPATANSRCWWTGKRSLMAALWQRWACCLQDAKYSMPFGPGSPGRTGAALQPCR